MGEIIQGQIDGGREPLIQPETKSRGLREQLSAFLEWVKPYKEFSALAIGIVAAIIGSIAWAVAHFATQAELFYLECRINNTIETRALRDKTDAFAAAIQIRNSQVLMLTEQPPSSNSNSSIRRLSDEINALTREQNNYSIEMKKRIDDNATRCIKHAPARESAGK